MKTCNDKFCEFSKHGRCVLNECVWKLSTDEQGYDYIKPDETPNQTPKIQ